MKRLLVVVSFIFFSTLLSQAQFKPRLDYSLAWHKGTVIFQTGDTLDCTLRYNHTLYIGTLQIVEAGNVITVPSSDVKKFSFYDDAKGRWRTFTSMTLEGEEPLNQKFFLEQLYYDEQFAILNHRTLDVPYDYMNYTRFISKPVRMTKRYLLDFKSGKILPLSKENTLKLLESQREEIIAFINQRHIRFKRLHDYIDVFEYHASL